MRKRRATKKLYQVELLQTVLWNGRVLVEAPDQTSVKKHDFTQEEDKVNWQGGGSRVDIEEIEEIDQEDLEEDNDLPMIRLS